MRSIVFAEVLAVLHFYVWYFSFVCVPVCLEILILVSPCCARCRRELLLLIFSCEGSELESVYARVKIWEMWTDMKWFCFVIKILQFQEI